MPLETVVLSLLATAGAILAATWRKSPVNLPLPPGRHARWLRVLPVLATFAIVAVLSTWYTDCAYLFPLTAVAFAALLGCAGLLIWHHDLLRRRSGANTLLVIICLSWSTLGTLSVSAAATMLVAKSAMDKEYRENPVTLWHYVKTKKQLPEDVIYLTSGISAHFEATMDECHQSTPEMEIFPSLGSLNNGTYRPPNVINEEQRVTITASSRRYGTSRSANIILLPDPKGIERRQYPIVDNEGAPGVLDLIIISKDDSWVLKSDEYVEHVTRSGNKELIPICRPLSLLVRSHALDPYVDLIAVGTASREGEETEEGYRAGNRGRKLAQWLNTTLSEGEQTPNVYTMNLGQYRVQPEDSASIDTYGTARERPVVLIGVVRRGNNDLAAAVREVVLKNRGDPFFKFLASHYPGREIELYAGKATGSCTHD